MNELLQTVELCRGVRAVPIVHGSVECAVRLREILLDARPSAVAVELPAEIGEAVERALPFVEDVPVVSASRNGGREVHFILEPLEPIVEALRSAEEHDVPRHYVDLFTDDREAWQAEAFPDTFALRYMSLADLHGLYETHGPRRDDAPAAIDLSREVHIARKLRAMAAFVSGGPDIRENVLFVGGLAHISSLRHLLSLSPDEMEAFADRESRENDPDAEPLESLMAGNQAAASVDCQVSTLSRESPEVLEQPPFFQAAWNLTRNNHAYASAFNRVDLQRAAYREAVNRYERESGELVPPQREKLFFRFARNWSLVEDRLLPDLYRLVISARGFGNDNFARIMYDTLCRLPPASKSPFPERKLTLDDLHRRSRLIRFRTRLRIKRKVPPPQILRRFTREKYPGEWRESWRGTGTCSYPPEDLQIENFGRFLQDRARAILQGSESRVLPFSASLMDGIDYRETIRNLHLNKIFVRDLKLRGLEAESVVVVFSDDEESFPWRVVWWGEHSQESDMAFYATPPGDQIVGPGIARCLYGGFMLTYPPGRLHNIWEDDFYDGFANPADKLLAAALEFNERNAVVHLAGRPPHARLQQIAGRMGQKIVHIPISTINAVHLGRVQRFHVLDSRGRRDEAGDFIW